MILLADLKTLQILEVDNVLTELLCLDLWDQEKIFNPSAGFSTITIQLAHSVGSSTPIFYIFESSSFTADRKLADIFLGG